MDDALILNAPAIYADIQAKTSETGFSMPSDIYVGTLLKTLVSSKPNGCFLELGTGTGLSLSWMADGMDAGSQAISVDNNPELVKIAQGFFENDRRVQIVCAEGENWINQYTGDCFDLIFADAWPGKYSVLEKTLTMIKPGGFYIVDDMLSQPNWPEGHQEKASRLIEYLEGREDINLTKMCWSTGLIIATKHHNKISVPINI